MGESGNDTLIGGAGNDTLHPGAGVNVAHGQAGNDVFQAGRGNDRLYGGAGNDLIAGNGGWDLLDGGDGNDTIRSGTITVTGGRNQIQGGAGNDVILGGRDADWIRGGSGQDRLAGGGGADLFIFRPGDLDRSTDVILDFTRGVDRLDMRGLHLDFIGSAAFSEAGQVRMWRSPTAGLVLDIDLNGDRHPDLRILLGQVGTLGQNDFCYRDQRSSRSL